MEKRIARLYLFVLLPGLVGAQTITSSGVDGSRSCAPCHRQIYEDYLKTGMGRAFYKPSGSNRTEDLSAAKDFYHAGSDTHFAMRERNGQLYQRRWQIGPGGEETNVEETRVDYVMGSGNHAKSYLSRTPRGTLIELPFGWYAEDRAPSPKSPSVRHWGMSPGSDTPEPLTRRFITYKCMFCHNAVPKIPEANAEPDSDPVFAGELPEGIDCSRCHGSGERHLQTVRSRASTRADVVASIVNPARLSNERRLEICMQCHLETSSGRIPAAIVRFDRHPFSYTPGEPLERFLLTFDQAPGTGHDDKYEAVNSVYRLRQSKCFRESAGPDHQPKMICETCHNPHRIPRGEAAVKQYDAVCGTCHPAERMQMLTKSSKHPAGGSCTGCHMPKRRAEDTPGMIMTDHLIQRRPGTNLLAEFREPWSNDYRGEVVPYYPSPVPDTAENRLYVAAAQVGGANNLAGGLPALAKEIAAQQPKQGAFYKVLGDGYRTAGEVSKAVEAYEGGVAQNPRSLAALRALAGGLIEAEKFGRAETVLKQCLEVAPGDPVSWYLYGQLEVRAGREAGAVEKFRRAIELDASLPNEHRELASVLKALGRVDEASSALAEALRGNPYDDAAWDLSGRMAAERGDAKQMGFAFEKAMKLRPQEASYPFDYALALARGGRLDEARRWVDEALRLAPERADVHELSGGLYEAKEQVREAVAEYRRALELKPEQVRVRARMEALLKRLGQ